LKKCTSPAKKNVAAWLKNKEPCHWSHFAGYEPHNNNHNIRRLKERLDQIEKTKAAPSTEVRLSGGVIVGNQEDNRVQIIFDDKPDA
jgi:hypothetical protein